MGYFWRKMDHNPECRNLQLQVGDSETLIHIHYIILYHPNGNKCDLCLTENHERLRPTQTH